MHTFILWTFWLSLVGLVLQVLKWAVEDDTVAARIASMFWNLLTAAYVWWAWMLLWGGWK